MSFKPDVWKHLQFQLVLFSMQFHWGIMFHGKKLIFIFVCVFGNYVKFTSMFTSQISACISLSGTFAILFINLHSIFSFFPVKFIFDRLSSSWHICLMVCTLIPIMRCLFPPCMHVALGKALAAGSSYIWLYACHSSIWVGRKRILLWQYSSHFTTY